MKEKIKIISKNQNKWVKLSMVNIKKFEVLLTNNFFNSYYDKLAHNCKLALVLYLYNVLFYIIIKIMGKFSQNSNNNQFKWLTFYFTFYNIYFQLVASTLGETLPLLHNSIFGIIQKEKKERMIIKYVLFLVY